MTGIQSELSEYTRRHAFNAWVNSPTGKKIKAEITRRALRLKAIGHKRYGFCAIWEAMRYDSTIEAGAPVQDFKLNNNHRSFLEDQIMEEVPALAGFFPVRHK